MPGSILILDGVSTNRIILTVKLSSARYRVMQAASVQQALGLALTRAPDLILVDHGIEGGGAEACQRLRRVPALRQTPIIVAAPAIGADLRLACFEAGADAMIEKPMNETLLLARIRNLLRRSAARFDLTGRPGARMALGLADPGATFRRACRVALVNNAPQTAAALVREFEVQGHRAQVFARADVEMLFAQRPFDAILVDLGIGEGPATLRLLTDLQSRSETRQAAHLCVIDDKDDASAVLALDLGTHDLIRTPPAPPRRELAIRIGRQLAFKVERERLVAELDAGIRLSVTDPLTGLYNRRYAMCELARVVEGCTPEAGFGVMVVDVDRFKSVNDRFGHAAGDAVLREIASRMRRVLRRGDTLARIGGEEFVAILPTIAQDAAGRLADRMRRAVSDRPVTLPGELGEVAITVSIGLSLGGGANAPVPAEAHLDSADRALFAAKGAGRNTVTLGPLSAA
ncbi:diguanylate cyclase [Anianabacter salinae]|uniref:diguanylate cyclase n=1 Tax=Anianabacter salinae TaxID=2851023 RepID=UPI00225E4A35|nr:diguanylate cyclase [Anianabacter salinae]MBV0911394.1 diguanylate cyclase [Anianabacter salinae]